MSHAQRSLLMTVLAVIAILAALAAAMSWFDPELNYPVVSQVVCSVKGDTWYGGGLLGAPGCYAPQGAA